MPRPSKSRRCPTLQPPAQWTAAGAGAGAVADNWLAAFHDDQLTAAVAEAIAHNADLRVGAARVEQALLYAKLAGAKLYPSVDLLARGGGKMSGDGSGIQGGVLSATWELDLWGRVRYGRAASAAQAASAQADFEYARQSIAALVAKSWFLATEAGLQVEAARETIRASEELVRLADDRARIGVGDQEDVFVARASVGSYRDVLRQLELGREQAIRALELLLGRYPSAAAATTPQLPGFPGEVPAGLPSELLERRPDVIAAERRVAAAFNRIQRGQGGAPAGHRADDRRQRDLERAVRAARITTIRCGASAPACSRRSSGAARSRRRSRFGRPSRNRRSPSMPRSDCAPSAKWKARWPPRSPRASASRS